MPAAVQVAGIRKAGVVWLLLVKARRDACASLLTLRVLRPPGALVKLYGDRSHMSIRQMVVVWFLDIRG